MNHYENCMQCPKKCGVNRTQKQKGFCQETDDLKIAFAGLHFGEEPLVTVFGGSDLKPSPSRLQRKLNSRLRQDSLTREGSDRRGLYSVV